MFDYEEENELNEYSDEEAAETIEDIDDAEDVEAENAEAENDDAENIDAENTDAESSDGEPEIKEYSDEYLMSAVEAILFSVGESVSLDQLATALSADKKKLRKQLAVVIEKYNDIDRGIRMLELEGAYQLCTKNEYFDILAKVVNTPKKYSLTDTLLETLSIIAYKQPITKPEIEAIRGVSCVHAVNRLMEFNLVQEVGRLDAPGRPILFGTTEEFLRCFGVSSAKDLPTISPDKIEDFKKEAREEADFTLSVDVSDGGQE